MSCPFSKNCLEHGDIRGMCFTCVGDFDDMTVNQLRNVIKCPNTPYAMAFWIHNNHHELWEKIKDTNIKTDYKGERILKNWISNQSFHYGLELLYKWIEDDERICAELWDYIVRMEDDDD